MESDPRYQWIEKRITSCLSPKREALSNFIENEDNKYFLDEFNFSNINYSLRLIVMEFLNNEDVKQLYIFVKSPNHLIASRSCTTENSSDKGIFFLKISNTSKLSPETMSKLLNS